VQINIDEILALPQRCDHVVDSGGVNPTS
jgi:hypothetical protein